ncbi:MAG TPA: hypothetical protein P5127_05825 [Oscillospiraceae bacterium]|nr:hypothetical protein [Oscillospiraceae bacterium]
MAKTIEKRLDDLESYGGNLPTMVFEQSWDNPDLFYLSGPNNLMAKMGLKVDKTDLMTRAEAIEKAGNKYTLLFITYVKDWRGDNEWS